MKKRLYILLISLIILIPLKIKALELDISSKKAILYNMDSGEILYEKNSNEKGQIASLTKIMTALISIENIDDIDKQVVIDSQDLKGLAEENLVTAGFTVGEVVTYKDLLYGLLLPSGADAAKALARNIAGNEEQFVKMMNDKALKLKLKNTHFSNVTGLDDENNYSSVKDLAEIFKTALKNQEFKKIITTPNYQTSNGKHTLKSTIQKNAKAFNIQVPYILGGKTGTTNNAGLCLATIAKENDVNYMLVTTEALYDKKAPHHIEDAKVIYDFFIENYSNQKIVDKTKSFKTLKTKYAKETKIKLYPKNDIVKYLPNNYDKNDIKYKYEGINEVTPFTKRKLGTLKIFYKKELISEETIYLKEKPHISIFNIIKENIIIISLLITIIIIIILKKRTRS